MPAPPRFNAYDAGASAGGGSSRVGYSSRWTDPSRIASSIRPTSTTCRTTATRNGSSSALDLANRGLDELLSLLGARRQDRTGTCPIPFLSKPPARTIASRPNDWNANLGWQTILSPTAFLDTTVFARNDRYTYYGSPNDPSVIANSKRSWTTTASSRSSRSRPARRTKSRSGAIFKSYPIKERFSFGITDPNLNDPASDGLQPEPRALRPDPRGLSFLFNGSKTITYLAGFVQDTLRFSNLTAQVGLRYDHANFPLTESPARAPGWVSPTTYPARRPSFEPRTTGSS